jgi:spermidine/putrescine transport system permease protein
VRRSRITGLITLAALVFLFVPLAVVVLFSFHRTGALSFPFTGFSLRWYRSVLSSYEFRAAAWNSLVVATAVAATTLLLGTAAAYGLSRSMSRLRGPLAALFFLPLTLPGLFLGIALLVYLIRARFQLSLLTVAIGHLIYVFPYFYLMSRAAIDRLDPRLDEAGADLGAAPRRVFWRVTLPQIWPILLAATALSFALSFDEFLITFFVIGSDSTLPLFIWSSIRRTIDPSINTVSSLLLAFTLGVWLLALLVAIRSGRSRAPDVVAGAGAGEAT